MKRNFDKIQFESIRKIIDPKFNAVHDELSDCYYGRKPFRTFGILTKEKFDKLHGLIFWKRDVDFQEFNVSQPKKDQIPESEYNEIKDKDGNIIAKKSDLATAKIQALRTEGLDLII